MAEQLYSVLVESRIMDELGEEVLDGVPMLYEMPLFSATLDKVAEFLVKNPHLVIDAEKMIIIQTKEFETRMVAKFSTKEIEDGDEDVTIEISILEDEEKEEVL